MTEKEYQQADLKKEAAKFAAGIIKNRAIVGLGGGSTISSLVECLAEERQRGLQFQVLTSSSNTSQSLRLKGFDVVEPASVSSLDLYFDGCDQFDKNLHALKSGGGIHTMEKLLAAMSKEFILVGDQSKYVQELSTKFPLAVEVFPEAVLFVEEKIREIYRNVRVTIRRQDDLESLFTTTHGNHLLDLWFEQWPSLSLVNPSLKSITGVVETSLFYNMAGRAIIAGKEGVRTIIKP